MTVLLFLIQFVFYVSLRSSIYSHCYIPVKSGGFFSLFFLTERKTTNPNANRLKISAGYNERDESGQMTHR